METKFRPIPITILDILAIFLPGFVWLILIATAFEMFRYKGGEIPTPILAWDHIVRSLKSADTWLAPFPLLVASLLLGYLLKPSAIVITERLAMQYVIRWRYSKEIKKSAKVMTADEKKGLWPFWMMKFPFDRIFKGTTLYREVHDILENKLACSPKEFPGTQIFATAKSYLKATSPTMWEESERREAEVRMAGVMYLAFFFSFLLSAIVLMLPSYHGGDTGSVWGWLVLSAVGTIVAGESFSLLRVSEVGYTYLNMLVACKCLSPAEESKSGVTSKVEGP